MSERGRWLGRLGVGLVLAPWLVLVVALSGCTSPDAKRHVEDAGYAAVTLTGYRFWGCSQDDWMHTGFRAVAPTGRHVTGVVCSGPLKGATIRLD